MESNLEIFTTGASGFVGGSVATTLVSRGHQVRGLVRDPAKVDAVAAFGITPVFGVLENFDLLTQEARSADCVINAASSDHRGAVDAILAGLRDSGKPFLHTSGSSVVADKTMGERSACRSGVDTAGQGPPRNCLNTSRQPYIGREQGAV
jgi:uncharacterized protein YbjT (DUF2867 family)